MLTFLFICTECTLIVIFFGFEHLGCPQMYFLLFRDCRISAWTLSQIPRIFLARRFDCCLLLLLYLVCRTGNSGLRHPESTSGVKIGVSRRRAMTSIEKNEVFAF